VYGKKQLRTNPATPIRTTRYPSVLEPREPLSSTREWSSSSLLKSSPPAAPWLPRCLAAGARAFGGAGVDLKAAPQTLGVPLRPIQRHESQDLKHPAGGDDPVLQPPGFARVRTRSTVGWLG